MRSFKRNLSLALFLFIANIASASPTPPDFSVWTTDQDSFHLHDEYLDQGKVVLIEFFFTTCPPCAEIAPYMEGLYQDWGGGNEDVEFILISNQSFDDNDDVAQYEDNYGFTFPGVGVDGGAIGVWNLYKDSPWGTIFGTPAFIVIAPDGSVQYDVSGPTVQATIDSLNAALERAVNMTGPPPAKHFQSIVSTHYASGDTIQDVEAFYYDYPTAGDTSVGMPFMDGNLTQFLPDSVSSNSSFRLEMHKDDPSNIKEGLSTFDILLIQMAILGFREPGFFEKAAGDINRDGKLTGGDIVSLRRVILSIVNEFGTTPTWQFYPDYIPENDLDSLQYDEFWDFPEEWTYAPDGEMTSTLSFLAVKMGDVNASWTSLHSSESPQERFEERLYLNASHDNFAQSYTFYPPALSDKTYSFQFDIKLDLDTDVSLSTYLPDKNFMYKKVGPHTLRIGYYNVDGKYFSSKEPIFILEAPTEIAISNTEWYTDLLNPKRLVLNIEQSPLPITIYPNPCQDNCIISGQNPISVSIYDETGREVKSLQLSAGERLLDLSDLPAGNYYLSAKERDWVKLLIKQ